MGWFKGLTVAISVMASLYFSNGCKNSRGDDKRFNYMKCVVNNPIKLGPSIDENNAYSYDINRGKY